MIIHFQIALIYMLMQLSSDNRGMKNMDIFDVLSAISKRKTNLMHVGINENEALRRAELDISEEFHIPLFDIEKLVGQ